MTYIIFIKVHDNIRKTPYYYTPANVYGTQNKPPHNFFLLPPNTSEKNIHQIIKELFIEKIFKKGAPYKNVPKLVMIHDVYWNGILYKTSKATSSKTVNDEIKQKQITAYEIEIDITTIEPNADLSKRLLSGCEYHKRVVGRIMSKMFSSFVKQDTTQKGTTQGTTQKGTTQKGGKYKRRKRSKRVTTRRKH